MTQIEKIPTLRFSEFNKNYSNYIFDEIVSITRLAGYEYSQYWEEDENEEIIALRGYNIGKGKLELRDLSYISNELSLKLNRSRLSKGDIVYPCVGSIGNAVVIEEDNKYHIQQNIAKITCKEGTNEYFISQFLMSHLGMREVLRFNATSSQPNVLVGSLRQFRINLPSYKEQQKIASFLSSVDKKIELLQKKKDLLEDYKKGVMQQIFSQQIRFKDDDGHYYPDWKEVELFNLGNTINGLTGKSKENFGSGKPYIQYKQIFDSSKIKIEDCGLVEISENENQTKVIFGDIFFTTSSETPNEIGTASVLLDEVGEMYLNSFCFGFRVNQDRLSPIFGQFLFRSSTFRRKMIPLAQGSTRYNISKTSFLKLKVKLPSLTEQIKIGHFLSSIDAKIAIIQSQIIETKNFKKGLLQQMFV